MNMNKKLIFSVVLTCVLLTIVAVSVFAQTNPNVRWEYTTSGRNLERANELGQQGWELFTTCPERGWIYKRRLR